MALAVANRVTVWLNTQRGYDEYIEEYNNPAYFLHFNVGYETDGTLQQLYNAFSYLQGVIKFGKPKSKQFPFAIVQNVTGGKAGSAYCYAEPALQSNIRPVETSIIDTCNKWGRDNNVPVSSPVFNPNKELYLSLYFSL